MCEGPGTNVAWKRMRQHLFDGALFFVSSPLLLPHNVLRREQSIVIKYIFELLLMVVTDTRSQCTCTSFSFQNSTSSKQMQVGRCVIKVCFLLVSLVWPIFGRTKWCRKGYTIYIYIYYAVYILTLNPAMAIRTNFISWFATHGPFYLLQNV